MKKIKYLLFVVFALLSATTILSSCSSDDDDDIINAKTDYDILQINGENYAVYGYRCDITYGSSWYLDSHHGELLLPCGKLSDALKGEYDYDDLFGIQLEGNQNLKKGSRLENFSPVFECYLDHYDYVSGSATIIDKKDDEYLIVKFASFKFSDGTKSYTLNGTVQLDLDED